MVLVLHQVGVDALTFVELHHEPDRRLREVVLQLVVGVVDQQLLEAIYLEDLRAEDIEQPDEQLLAAPTATCRGGVTWGGPWRRV